MKKSPTSEEITEFVEPIAKELTGNIKAYSFNFEIFPENSTKIPGDSQIHDSYANVVYRNRKVIFPVDYQLKENQNEECRTDSECPDLDYSLPENNVCYPKISS